MAFLLTKPGQLDRTGWSDLHDRIAVVPGPGSLDHRCERAVMNALDVVEFVLVAVPLKDREDLTRRLQDLPHLGAVLDTVAVADIETLMSKHNRGSGG